MDLYTGVIACHNCGVHAANRDTGLCFWCESQMQAYSVACTASRRLPEPVRNVVIVFDPNPTKELPKFDAADLKRGDGSHPK